MPHKDSIEGFAVRIRRPGGASKTPLNPHCVSRSPPLAQTISQVWLRGLARTAPFSDSAVYVAPCTSEHFLRSYSMRPGSRARSAPGAVPQGGDAFRAYAIYRAPRYGAGLRRKTPMGIQVTPLNALSLFSRRETALGIGLAEQLARGDRLDPFDRALDRCGRRRADLVDSHGP
jgi:hypothetical protein